MYNNFYEPGKNDSSVYNPYFPPVLQQQVNKVIVQNSNRELRSLSVTAGFCVLGFIALQYLISIGLSLAGLADDYLENTLFQNAFGTLYSAVCVFLPFFLVALSMEPKKRSETLLFGKPFSVKLMLLAVPAGFLFCMFGNYATTALISLMNSVGVTLTAPETPVPSTGLGMVMYVVQIAFVPALVEEFALRGVVMQPLRKYGDMFAVIMSALVFALMHGNMVQAPFAFIAGITIGYFVIATGSLWTGVLIHFSNNLFSSLFTLAEKNASFSIDKPYAAVMSASFVIGLACCVFFAVDKNRNRLKKPQIPVSRGRRTATYILTFPMAAALLAILYATMAYIKFGG